MLGVTLANLNPNVFPPRKHGLAMSDKRLERVTSQLLKSQLLTGYTETFVQ